MTKEGFFQLLSLARHLKMKGRDPTQRRQSLEAALAYFRYHAFHERRASCLDLPATRK